MTIATEPQIGDTKITATDRYIYAACEGCGEARWAEMRNGEPRHKYCVVCGRKTQWQNRHSIPEQMKDKYDAIHRTELEYCERTGRCPKCDSMIIMQDDDGYHCFCGKTIYS